MNAKFSSWSSLRGLAKNALGLLAMATAALVLCLPTFAQDVQGSIRGAVLDQSGGAIAGATVTVIDVARGGTRTLTTDETGQYLAINLTPGTYTVRVAAKGFRTAEHSGLLLQVSESIRVDLVVQPGEQTQTITVNGEVPAIDTTDAILGGAVSNNDINSLPLNGRNFQRLLELRPGVVYIAQGGRSGSSSTNGRRTGGDLILVEGIPQIDQAFGGSSINAAYASGEDTASIMPIDAIQEFATMQSPKAEYGFKDGSVVSVGVKSGTNSLHGTAYAYGRDAAATDAANPFTSQVTPATVEQFGGTVGGRAIKDKIFFFAGFEGLRAVVGSTAVDTIPVDVSIPATGASGIGPGCTTLKSGTCSASMVDACHDLGAAKISPLSALLAGLNTTTCAVTPVSSAFENIFPYTLTTATANNFAPGAPSTTPLNNGMIKGDWNISSHHHLDGMYFVSKATQINGAMEPIWNGDIVLDTQTYDANWTWTPNSTLVNDFRFGFAYLQDSTLFGDRNLLPSNAWPNGYGLPTGVTNPVFGGLPTIAISGGSFTSLGNGSRAGTRGPDGTLDFKDSVSYLRGNHAFKAGFEYADVILDEDRFAQAQGSITFPSLEGFLQGTPSNGSILSGNPVSNIRQHWFAGFVQDDWRINRRLTANFGLRYEYFTSITERNNYIGNFNPSVNPATTPAVEQAGPGAPISSMWQHPTPDLLMPRFGLAWDIQGNGKTVLRGGVGMFTSAPSIPELRVPFEPFGANFFGGTAASPTLIADNTGTQANAFTPLSFSFKNKAQLASLWNTTGPIFPNFVPLIVGGKPYSSVTCQPAVPCSTGALASNFTVPRSVQWNLDLQRAITNSLTLDVAYVGNHGWNEQYLNDLNEPAIGAGWPAPVSGNNTFICMTAPTYVCNPNTTLEVGQYSTTFPYLNYIMQSQSGVWSNYDALQVTLSQRVSHGLSFLAGYTYGHALDIYSSVSQSNVLLSNPLAPGLDYGNSDNDIRHRFTFSPSYAIPGIKSPGQMLEGWSISGILLLQSGAPWYPDDNNKTDWLGTGEFAQAFSTQVGQFQFWNYSGPKSAFNEGLSPIPCYAGAVSKYTGCVGTLATAPAAIASACANAATAPYGGATTSNGMLALAALANSACYIQKGGVLTPPAYGTQGNAGRNIFRNQPYYNVDFSVAKMWHFRERYSAQFRLETFNLFNRVDWAGPSANPTSPNTFGQATTTADNGNAVLGSGGPRHIQFALKLTF
jgi:Carboxypeptidase regulatory-like domain